MSGKSDDDFKQLLAQMQQQWGQDAVQLASIRREATYLSTGFPELDVAFGGYGRGRLTEMCGQPTSGMTTLALKAMGMAQQSGDVVVYIDLSATFDPDYAIRCGVMVEEMLLVRPQTLAEGLNILLDAITSHLPGMVVFHAAGVLGDIATLPAVLRRLHPALAHSRCVLLTLLHPDTGQTAWSELAALRLHVACLEWLYQDEDVTGCRAEVTILKTKSGIVRQCIPIEVNFEPTKKGDEA